MLLHGLFSPEKIRDMRWRPGCIGSTHREAKAWVMSELLQGLGGIG